MLCECEVGPTRTGQISGELESVQNGFVTTSARNVATICYDLDLKNHSVLATLLRRYDLKGDHPTPPILTLTLTRILILAAFWFLTV